MSSNALTGQMGTRSNFSGNSTYQESRYPAGDSFPPRYVLDDSARAHVKDKRERYAENRNNQHGLLKASGAESFRDRGGTRQRRGAMRQHVAQLAGEQRSEGRAAHVNGNKKNSDRCTPMDR